MSIDILYGDKEKAKNVPYAMKEDMIHDLYLNLIFEQMSKKDEYILSAVKNITLLPLTNWRDITYRQAAVMDCAANRHDIEGLYQQVTKTVNRIEQYREQVERKQKNSGSLSKTAGIYTTMEILLILLNGLEELRDRTVSTLGAFTSEAMLHFQDYVEHAYNYELIHEMKGSIKEMAYLARGGNITVTAGICPGMKIGDSIVNEIEPMPKEHGVFWTIFHRVYCKIFKGSNIILKDASLIYQARAMEDESLIHMLEIYQEFIKNLQDFFENLRYQMAFYYGATNFVVDCSHLKLPLNLPTYVQDDNDFKAKGLYDLGLALHTHILPVANEFHYEDKHLMIISGANQGGKSTFLRSIGVAQILMQAGLPVPAVKYQNRLYDNIMTHFTRREDQAMNRGRLEEELKRMDRIVSNVYGKTLVLLNESFASTTEADGAMIASDLVGAFHHCGVDVFMVTHLFAFVKEMYDNKKADYLFLSAQRLDNGTRTYQMKEEVPSETSYGIDLYDEIIGHTN